MWIRIELYFMSLSLLFFLLTVKSLNIPMSDSFNLEIAGWRILLYENIPTLICLMCLFWSLLCKKRFFNSLKGSRDLPCMVKRVQKANYEYLAFFNLNVIPLICFNLGMVADWLLLFTLLALWAFMFINTNICYRNPILALMGYNVYVADIVYKNSIINDVIIISQLEIKTGDVIYKHNMENNEVIYCSEKK